MNKAPARRRRIAGQAAARSRAHLHDTAWPHRADGRAPALVPTVLRGLLGASAFGLLLLTAIGSRAAEPPKPVLEGASGTCVAPPAEMRRNHMEMLKHQRDRTLREGVRGARVSLNACVECHAGKQTGSVASNRKDFCESCHSYAAVKLDCFECHQAKAGRKVAVANGVKP